MKTRIAIAQLYGNKIHYFLEKSYYYRGQACSEYDKLQFPEKNQMFKEWNILEELNILDPNLRENTISNIFFSI
jgi:hypothetical protein